jgi:hypothetical protein
VLVLELLPLPPQAVAKVTPAMASKSKNLSNFIII